jgi:hypothetical protein
VVCAESPMAQDGSGDIDLQEFEQVYKAVIGRVLGGGGGSAGSDSASADSKWYWLGIRYRWAQGGEVDGGEHGHAFAQLAAAIDSERERGVSISLVVLAESDCRGHA